MIFRILYFVFCINSILIVTPVAIPPLHWRVQAQEIDRFPLTSRCFLRSVINCIVAGFRCAQGKVSLRGIPGAVRWNRKSKKKSRNSRRMRLSRSLPPPILELVTSICLSRGRFEFSFFFRRFRSSDDRWSSSRVTRCKDETRNVTFLPAPSTANFTTNYDPTVQPNYITPTFWSFLRMTEPNDSYGCFESRCYGLPCKFR